MSNMSYCRFENTYNDLKDCEEALAYIGEISESETKYKNKLIDLCKEISENFTVDYDKLTGEV